MSSNPKLVHSTLLYVTKGCDTVVVVSGYWIKGPLYK